MTPRVDLVLTGTAAEPATWTHGEVHVAGDDPTEIARLSLVAARHEAVLWWDPALGPPPDPAAYLAQPDDVWHAGLLMGQGGRPGRLAHVAPAWMLGADPDEQIPATSWRVSLRACLARSTVLHAIGGPDPSFRTLSGAGLDVGLRWITHGALCRHSPAMVTDDDRSTCAGPRELDDEDEIRIIERQFGRRWAMVSVLVGSRSLRAGRTLRRVRREPRPAPDDLVPAPVAAPTTPTTVSVIIPTLDRYPWLTTVLSQLRDQTLPPSEVIVVDQTALDRRKSVPGHGLPLAVLHLDAPGQSTARNAAIHRATGDLLLFVDDDDEIGPTLIEDHAAVIEHRRVDVSSGVAAEPGDPPPTAEFRRFRAADVFPTNNTMARASTVSAVGGFDPAFDHGVRADHELGTRLYLSGARMVLSPEISVIHHRAPSGGLRHRGARRQTAASSRRTLTRRQPIGATEVLLWRRHHPGTAEAAMRLRLGTNLVGTGSPARRFCRAVTQVMLLPAAMMQLRAARRDAETLAGAHAPPTAGTP